MPAHAALGEPGGEFRVNQCRNLDNNRFPAFEMHERTVGLDGQRLASNGGAGAVGQAENCRACRVGTVHERDAASRVEGTVPSGNGAYLN
jgi:hypothetical protein